MRIDKLQSMRTKINTVDEVFRRRVSYDAIGATNRGLPRTRITSFSLFLSEGTTVTALVTPSLEPKTF